MSQDVCVIGSLSLPWLSLHVVIPMKRPAPAAGDGPQKKPAARHSWKLHDQYDTLPGIADRMLRQLSTDQITNLKDTLMGAKHLNVGGSCTGSNAPLYAMHVLTKKLKTQHITETFTCEHVHRLLVSYLILQ